MPIISKVGTRSWRVRALYAAIFAVLILGAVTMVYPFLLMLARPVKSEADSADISPYPRFWFDDTVLFQKYVESKYNVRVQTAEAAWWEPAPGWRSIQPPTQEGADFLDDFLAWRDVCPWWTLGHTGGARLLPINARLFRHVMYDRFHGDLDSFCREMELPVKSWSAVIPPPYPAGRYPAQHDGYMGAFNDFAPDHVPYKIGSSPTLTANTGATSLSRVIPRTSRSTTAATARSTQVTGKYSYQPARPPPGCRAGTGRNMSAKT